MLSNDNLHKVVNCVKLADELLASVQQQIASVSGSRAPTLAVILVGVDPASQLYVKNKKNACNMVGIKSVEFLLPITISEQELLQLITQLNHDITIDGILVQLPLPAHINNNLVINTIFPHKDVDGFHKYNMGALATNDEQIIPCTPQGIIYILDSIKFNYVGKHIVIIGTSNIVGRPMALATLNRHATVTLCNSKTPNITQVTATADVLIVAVGKPRLIKHTWLKANSIVIDVGINRDHQGVLCGDVDFDDVLNIVSYITPVPSGVGKMTVAVLMQNTYKCYQNNILQK